MKIFKYISILICLSLYACEDNKTAEVDAAKPFFEGEINLSESRGLYGSLSKVHTTYFISENYLKREQRLGGINSILETYAGMIIDLEKDSVVLYYSDKISGNKNKHTLSIQEHKLRIEEKLFSTKIPSCVDNTFSLFHNYHLVQQVKDSATIKGFKSDYTLYTEEFTGTFKQVIFDSKEIKVKRELLEMAFMDLPKEINFPLSSHIKSPFEDISNDSIVNGEKSKAIDRFLREAFQDDPNKKIEKTNLEKLAKNRWIGLGLNIFKKGVALNFHITTDVTSFTIGKIAAMGFGVSLIGFDEILEFDDFMSGMPNVSGGGFDD